MHRSWGARSGAVPCAGAVVTSAHTVSRDLFADPNVSSGFYPEAVACETETLLRFGRRCSFAYVTVLTIGKWRRKK